MFGWLRRRWRVATNDGIVATQPPGEVFPWHKGAVLTAIDEVVLALPMALLDKERPLDELIFGQKEMQINVPMEGDAFFPRLMPGMSVSLAKSCQAYVVADDNMPRHIKVTQLPEET
jgi:hypothetical protein